MGRLYTVSFTDVAVSAAQDLFEIAPAANKPVQIHGLFLGQTSDVGDAQDELLRYSVIRGHATSGSGGTTPTPAPHLVADTAAGFAAEVNNTTIASTGTTTTLHVGVFNIRSGEALLLTPELRWRCHNGSSRIVVRIPAPTDSLTMSGTLYVEEIN